MAWGTFTESAYLTLDGDFEAVLEGSDAMSIALNPREAASMIFTVDVVGTTDDVEVRVLQGHQIVTGLGLDAGNSTVLVDLNTSSDPIAADGDETGTWFVMTSGDEQGEMRLVTDSTDTNDRITLDHALSGTPSASETYDRYRLKAYDFLIDCGASVSEDQIVTQGFTAYAEDGQYVLVMARATGATNAHRLKVSYQVDGVSI